MINLFTQYGVGVGAMTPFPSLQSLAFVNTKAVIDAKDGDWCKIRQCTKGRRSNFKGDEASPNVATAVTAALDGRWITPDDHDLP